MAWNISPHPISDLKDWSELGRIELRPDFQRKSVWTKDAKIMLIDTILKNIPMPKIYLANQIKGGSTYRVVIDGQQRISTILEFLRNEFALSAPYEGPEAGKCFKDLSLENQKSILSYRIDFNEAANPSDEEVRNVYSRVNKYTFALTKQELRRADYPGAFLDSADEIALWDKFEKYKIFTAANRRRYGDAEYISEILAALIGGVQDKKNDLDDFYKNYAKWADDHKKKIYERLNIALRDIDLIFDASLPIADTRFRQKSDFYSLVLALDNLNSEGMSIAEKNLQQLREDLRELDHEIAPESDIEVCSEYAIKCVSQANSRSSRRWRVNFLKSILSGSYADETPLSSSSKIFYRYMDQALDLRLTSEVYCPSPDGEGDVECIICKKGFSGETEDWLLCWPSGWPFQFSNSEWAHKKCLEQSKQNLLNETLIPYLDRPEKNASNIL